MWVCDKLPPIVLLVCGHDSIILYKDFITFISGMLGARETREGSCIVTRIFEWIVDADWRYVGNNEEFISWNTTR